MNVRNAVIGFAVSAVATGVVVSCGGGGGYGGGGGGGGAVTYTVGGTLANATGNVTLKLNGANDMIQGNGSFTFPNGLAYLSTYNVQVVDAADRCTVANGAGTVGLTNITNVTVTCAAQGAEKVVRSALLSFAQETPAPPTASSGIGAGGVIADPSTKAITGGITFSGLTGNATAAHIHRGDTSIAVGLVLAPDNATAVLPVGATLSPSDYNELLAGTLYFNVHTVANPNGEIRGQINLQGGVGAGVASLDKAQEVPPSTSTATGTGTLIFDRATRNILISYVTHNVTNATLAHIHDAVPGTNGPVIVGFSNLTANFDGLGVGNNLAFPAAGSQVPVANVGDFDIDYFYFNVHSGNNLCAPAPDCSAGEIRGNITHLQ
jgi:hypothetical protein